MKNAKFIIILCILAALVLGTTAYRQHAARQASAQRFYLSRVFSGIHDTCDAIDAVLSDETLDFSRIVVALNRLDVLLDVGQTVVDARLPFYPDLSFGNFSYIASYMEGYPFAVNTLGTANSNSGSTGNTATVSDPSSENGQVLFAADGVLTEQEKQFLHILREDLRTLQTSLTGEDGLNMRSSLSIPEFAAAWQAFLQGWTNSGTSFLLAATMP